MPEQTTRHHDRNQWSPAPRGVTVEDTAEVGVDRFSMEPRIAFRGGMVINDRHEFGVYGPVGSRHDWLTVAWGPPVIISVGCFVGPVDTFRREVEMKADADKSRAEYEDLLWFIERQAARYGRKDSGVPESGLGHADLRQP